MENWKKIVSKKEKLERREGGGYRRGKGIGKGGGGNFDHEKESFKREEAKGKGVH
jgi:hypothetical protein